MSPGKLLIIDKFDNKRLNTVTREIKVALINLLISNYSIYQIYILITFLVYIN
jgi:hypothetical protein